MYHFAVITFRDAAGAERELRGSHGEREPPQAGSEVPITYDAADPANAWITGTSGPWVIPWVVLLAGVGVVIASFTVRASGS